MRALLAAGLITGAAAQPSALATSGGNIEPTRTMIEHWEQFAENRGYRIDLDDTGRIMTVSDAERFEVFTSSKVTVERTLEALEPFVGKQVSPIVLLRATDERDAETARIASDALGFGQAVHVIVETGTLAQRRAVDARLAEMVVEAELALFAPHLSEWMVDGLASAIAEDVTGRAMIEGEAVTLRQVRSQVARDHRRDESAELDLLRLSGRQPDAETEPLEAEAMRVMAHLRDEYEDTLPRLVTRLGSAQPSRGEGKTSQEARELRTALGIDALARLQDELRRR